jgi:hypothetical protein
MRGARAWRVANEIFRRIVAPTDLRLCRGGLTHGRGGVSRVLLGSVADRVIRRAPWPVLTVRKPE